MTLTEQFEADVAGVEPDAPLHFTYRGKPFVGQRTPVLGKLVMGDAGFELVFDFSMEVRRSQFTDQNINPPSDAEIITMDNVEYCIVATSPDQLGIVNYYAVKQRS